MPLPGPLADFGLGPLEQDRPREIGELDITDELALIDVDDPTGAAVALHRVANLRAGELRRSRPHEHADEQSD